MSCNVAVVEHFLIQSYYCDHLNRQRINVVRFDHTKQYVSKKDFDSVKEAQIFALKWARRRLKRLAQEQNIRQIDDQTEKLELEIKNSSPKVIPSVIFTKKGGTPGHLL